MKIGDLVKFSKEHYSNSPGYEYVKDWFGVIIEITPTPDNRRHHRHCPGIDEIEIMWTIHGGLHIAKYDELWWRKLDYKPFEVIHDEDRRFNKSQTR